jgi:flagellar motor switch protein FliN
MEKKENGMGSVREIKVPVQVILGETELSIEDLAKMDAGSIIQLKNFSGDPVSLYAAGNRVARGEVVVIDEYFGIRLTEILKQEE